MDSNDREATEVGDAVDAIFREHNEIMDKQQADQNAFTAIVKLTFGLIATVAVAFVSVVVVAKVCWEIAQRVWAA